MEMYFVCSVETQTLTWRCTQTNKTGAGRKSLSKISKDCQWRKQFTRVSRKYFIALFAVDKCL